MMLQYHTRVLRTRQINYLKCLNQTNLYMSACMQNYALQPACKITAQFRLNILQIQYQAWPHPYESMKMYLSMLMPYYMKKKIITQLILDKKLTHYLRSLWACPDTPEHTQVKWISYFYECPISYKYSA